MNKSRVKNPKYRKYLNGEKGSVLLLTVIFIFAGMGMAGLVIDYSRAVWARAQMQKAADSAALAGGSYLPSEAQATMQSSIMLSQNYPNYTGATFTPGNEEFTVTISDSVPTFFMRLFGHPTIPVSVTAKAVTRVNAGGLRGGAFPFCLINPNLNNDPADDLEPYNYGERYILGYGEDNVNVPDWANGSDPCFTPSEFGPAKGWRSALGLALDGTMDPGAGAGDIRDAFVNGWSGDLVVGDEAAARRGNIVSMNLARDARLAQTDLQYEDFNPRTDSGDPRVILVPIVHMINSARGDTYTVEDYNNGAAWNHDWVVIDGFAPFFLLSVEEQGDVNQDGNVNDAGWITGIFLPPITINNYLPPNGYEPEWGVYATARLVE